MYKLQNNPIDTEIAFSAHSKLVDTNLKKKTTLAIKGKIIPRMVANVNA